MSEGNESDTELYRPGKIERRKREEFGFDVPDEKIENVQYVHLFEAISEASHKIPTIIKRNVKKDGILHISKDIKPERQNR